MTVDAGAGAAHGDWWYGRLATLAYEIDKPVGTSLSGDVEFYADRLAGVAGTVLEPAVGTGRMLIPLIERGFAVHGYDTSVEMLDACRANCAARGIETTLFQADMAEWPQASGDPERPGDHAAVIVSTGSLMLLPDRESLAAALRGFRRSLAEDGLLIVDVLPPRPVSVHEAPRYWWHGAELITLQRWHAEYDDQTRRTSLWLRYELWRAGELVRTELQFATLLGVGAPEFAELLRQCGFDRIAGHGGYRAGREPRADDHVWTFEARRR